MLAKWEPELVRLFICLASIALCSGCTTPPSNVTGLATVASGERMTALQLSLDERDAGQVFVVAHRGCWSAAPENSLQAMRDCIRMGVEVAEIDVHLTKSGDLVVFHDRTLERMTNGTGLLRDKTLSEIRALRLYERDGSPHQIMGRKLLTNQAVPTLRELFEVTRGQLMINLEIKANEDVGFAATYSAALELAREMGVENEVMWKIPSAAREYDIEIIAGFSGSSDPFSPSDRFVSAIDLDGLRYVTPIVWQSERPFSQQLADFAAYDINAFEIVTDNISSWPTMRDGRVVGSDRFRYMGIAVLPEWSGGLSDDVALSNPDAAWGRLVDLGADLIMTDRPEQLIRFLEARGRR